MATAGDRQQHEIRETGEDVSTLPLDSFTAYRLSREYTTAGKGLNHWDQMAGRYFCFSMSVQFLG